MSNISEMIGMSENSTSAFKNIFAAVGAVADVAGAVTGIGGAIDLVLTLINRSQDSLASVLSMLKTLNEHQRAADIAARLTNLDNIYATAQKHVEDLKASLAANPPLDNGARIAQVADCREAIDRIVGFNRTAAAGAFLAPAQDQIFYEDSGAFVYPQYVQDYPPPNDGSNYRTVDVGYGQNAPAPDVNGQVFSQFYVVALLLYVELIFIAIGSALIENFTSLYADDIEGDANYLMLLHDTIRDGVRLKVPKQRSGNTPFVWDAPTLFASAWDGRGRYVDEGVSQIIPSGDQGDFTMTGVRIDMGAVELYSGASTSAQHVLMFTDVLPGETGVPLNVFSGVPEALSRIPSNPALYKKFQLRVERQVRDLYRIIGLREIAEASDRLRMVIGKPPLRTAVADYSLRSFARIAGDAAYDASASRYSAGRLYDLAVSTPPTDTDTRPAFTRSLRAALIN